jgi:hypothetical protein
MKDLQITVIPAQITDNFDVIKADLQEQIKAYDIEVTPDNLTDAKKAATDLNKLSATIDKTRKEKAKELSAPVKAFEAKAKELVGIVQGSRTKIVEQVKTFEDKVRLLCHKLLTEELARLNEELQVKPEFQTATIDKLAIQSNVTNSLKLAKKAKEAVKELVESDKAMQETVESRLSGLQSIAERAGLHGLSESLVTAFIREPEAIYTNKLNTVIDSEIKRQKQLEERIRADEERKAKEAAERAEIEQRHAREAEEAERIKQQQELERKERELQQKQIELEERARQAKIDAAMALLEPQTETQQVKEKPTKTKIFLLNAQIKMSCDIAATQEDAANALRHIISENNGQVLNVKVIGE